MAYDGNFFTIFPLDASTKHGFICTRFSLIVVKLLGKMFLLAVYGIIQSDRMPVIFCCALTKRFT